MRKMILASLALSALMAAPAVAADLRRPAPMKAPPPPPPPIFSWTGCYVGGHLGGLWVNKDWERQLFNDPFFVEEESLVDVIEPHGGHDVDGFLGGIQGGCDYQFGGAGYGGGGGFVIGIAADFAWADSDGDHIRPFRFFEDNPARFRSEVESVASVTARLGWAFDRFLIYVKGGVAWERDKFHVNLVDFLDEWHASDTRTGFTVGAGAEFAFTNFLSVFVEGNWYSFDDENVRFNHGIVDFQHGFCEQLEGGCGARHFNWKIEEEKFVVKAGLNFRFGGWGAPPVAARY